MVCCFAVLYCGLPHGSLVCSDVLWSLLKWDAAIGNG
jgi:hypothetical protein